MPTASSSPRSGGLEFHHAQTQTGIDIEQGVAAMSASRTLALAFASLAATSVACAADGNGFSVLVNDHNGQPLMFQSTAALNKGDVINVQSFNAQPVMVLQIAMCDRDCPRMHLVGTMSLTPYAYPLAVSMSNRFVVPEHGHVSFWVQQVGDPLDIPITTRSQGFARLSAHTSPLLLSFAPPRLYPDTPPMPAQSANLDDGTLLARFYHRIFVSVSLADAGG
jgi:hypothetical protein